MSFRAADPGDVTLLNEARSRGLTRHIGVSNYNSTQLARAVEVSEAPIATNQVEIHPYLDRTGPRCAPAPATLASR